MASRAPAPTITAVATVARRRAMARSGVSSASGDARVEEKGGSRRGRPPRAAWLALLRRRGEMLGPASSGVLSVGRSGSVVAGLRVAKRAAFWRVFARRRRRPRPFHRSVDADAAPRQKTKTISRDFPILGLFSRRRVRSNTDRLIRPLVQNPARARLRKLPPLGFVFCWPGGRGRREGGESREQREIETTDEDSPSRPPFITSPPRRQPATATRSHTHTHTQLVFFEARKELLLLLVAKGEQHTPSPPSLHPQTKTQWLSAASRPSPPRR